MPLSWVGPIGLNTFKKIYIEITNRCNLSCSFCQPSCRPKAFMGPADFAEILKKISGHTGHLCLHVLGEALLHPDLELFLVMSRAQGFLVNLSSNGVLLSRNQALLLRQPALRQINISLRSFEQSGAEAALDAYLSGIFDFLNAVGSASPLLINLRLWHLNQAAAPEERAMDRLMLKRLERYFGVSAPIPENFTTGRGITLAPKIFLSRESRFAWPHAPAPDLGGRGYCRGLRDHLAILVDGTVVPCCLDGEGDIPLGNIFRENLPEILANPRTAAIREGFAGQRVVDPVCRRCSYRQRFVRLKSGVTEAPGIPALF